ncbi:hypothetical protein FHL15_011361 [Xylaria flabelliformis]|uniref:Uncharacterized protein n=1 Tax=Xylaria flabelliformis TaxID=2512241 RepID=A0A553HIG7_9PEZI|nr:hypothetical protein FHL15_011361 [Xylaria flabelliformis]
MKATLHAGSLLFAAATVVRAATQCPIEYDNPADDYDSPGYVDINPYFNGTGKIHMHSGCTYWRQNYPRNITRDSVGCLNKDGHLVPIEGDNCATFHFVGATGQIENYDTEIFRVVENNYVCGWDFSTQTGKWKCADEKSQGGGFFDQILNAPTPNEINPYYYFSDYTGSEISTAIYTFYIQHPPTSNDDAQSLEYHIPDNPYQNQTFLPGDGTYPVIMELVVESL